MPTVRPVDNVAGPYICPAHTQRVNNDRDELRDRIPQPPWRVVDETDGPGLLCTKAQPKATIGWDPLAGVGVEEFLGILAAAR